jgi:hypothetical protein
MAMAQWWAWGGGGGGGGGRGSRRRRRRRVRVCGTVCVCVCAVCGVRCACACAVRACAVCCVVLLRVFVFMPLYYAVLRAAGCWVCACFPDPRPGFAKLRTEAMRQLMRLSFLIVFSQKPASKQKPQTTQGWLLGAGHRGASSFVLWQCCGCGCEL